MIVKRRFAIASLFALVGVTAVIAFLWDGKESQVLLKRDPVEVAVGEASVSPLAASNGETLEGESRVPAAPAPASSADAPTDVTPRRLPPDFERWFTVVELDERQRETWSHEAMLEWGCKRAPSAAAIPEIFDHAYVRLRIPANKPLEQATEEQRTEIERLQNEYLATCGDLLDESRALAQLLVEETNQPRNVRYFASKDDLLAADPALPVEQWGYVLGWSCDGAYGLVRFDSKDDAQLSANIRRIEELKRVRDRAVKRVLAQTP